MVKNLSALWFARTGLLCFRKSVKLLPVLLLTAFAVSVYAQEPIITLRHAEIGEHQRPDVKFNHELHIGKVDCLQCHHDFDAYMNNRGGEGQPCGTCHGTESNRDTISLRDAFHFQCKGCHEYLRSQGKPGGATTCGECHVREQSRN